MPAESPYSIEDQFRARDAARATPTPAHAAAVQIAAEAIHAGNPGSTACEDVRAVVAALDRAGLLAQPGELAALRHERDTWKAAAIARAELIQKYAGTAAGTTARAREGEPCDWSGNGVHVRGSGRDRNECRSCDTFLDAAPAGTGTTG